LIFAPLRGKNPTLSVGFLLEPVLQSSPGPFAAFGFDFHFDLFE
jgi:hypothetical protein